MAAVAERHYRALGALDRVAGFTTAPHGTAEALPGDAAARARHRFRAPPDSRCRRRRGRRADARAGAHGDRGRSGAGASVGRRVLAVACPRRRPRPRGQDRPDARTAQVGRRHLRDEHGAPPHLAHQGRPPQEGDARAHADAGDLRCAGRRPCNHRLRADRSGCRPRSSEARAVLARRGPRMQGARPGDSGSRRRRSWPMPANETPKPDDPAFASAEFRIIATPADSLAAAAREARRCRLRRDRPGRAP